MAARRSSSMTLLAVYVALGSFLAALAARGFLVPLVAHDMGAGLFTVGLLFTVMTLAGAVVAIPSGFVADRFGRRRIVVAGALTAGLTQLGVAFSYDVRMALLLQLVGGAGSAAAQTALYATVVDEAPARHLGRVMGWMTLSMQMGFLCGPALAGILARFITLRADLAVTSALATMPVAAALLMRRSGLGPARRPLWGAVREVFASPAFVPITIGLFGATLLWGTTQAFLPLFAREQLGLGPAAIGYMLTIQAVSNGASRIPGGRVVDRVRRKGLIVALGVAGYAAAVMVLPHTGGFWKPTVLLAAGVPLLATAFIALSVAFGSLSSPTARGTAMGIYNAVLFAGLAVGPAIFGLVMQRSGYTAGLTACAVTAVALAGTMLLLRAIETRARSGEVLAPPAAPGP